MNKTALYILAIALFSACDKSISNQPPATSSNTNDGGTYTTLINFNETNGATPNGSLIVYNNMLYGMVSSGGKYGDGLIFSVSTDGTVFNDLHDFSGTTTDGNQPYADLTLVGSTLFGTTRLGGTNNNGTIFSMNANGAAFNLLHSFGTGTDGYFPQSNLAFNGTSLIGTTTSGGSQGGGTIYSISTAGTNYNSFYSFNSTQSYSPFAGVTLAANDTAIYGTAKMGGGVMNVGVVYTVWVDGSHYKNLVVFNTTNGASPMGSLLLAGNTLYGMTNAGGANSLGNVFSVDTNGSAFKDILDFGGSNGASPYGALILNGTKLYGTTYQGGNYLEGNIFTISIYGTNYVDLFDMGSGSFGTYPMGSLLIYNNLLYGMTTSGGTGAYGTIFSCSL